MSVAWAVGRTRTQLRRAVAKEFEPLKPFLTGTADAGSDTNTIVDADVLGSFSDNKLRGMHGYFVDESPDTDEVRVSSSSQSATSVDFYPTEGAEVDSEEYELLPFSATTIHRALDDVLLSAWNEGLVGRDVAHIGFTGSPIYNSTFDFFDAAATADGWTATGNITLSQALTTGTNTLEDLALGTSNMVAVSTAAGQVIRLDGAYRNALLDFAGQSTILKALVL